MSEGNKAGKYRYLNEDCIMPLNFYNYKQPFLGSSNGMRYRISLLTRELPLPADAKEGDKPPVEKLLLSEIWPEPYAYDITPKEGIKAFEYPFDQESYEKLLLDLDSRAADFGKA